jgi:DNA end-binding protein Ku
MEIIEFVKVDEIDPLYFDASYYAAKRKGERAYHLLLDAIIETGFAAIAKVTMHNRKNILRARKEVPTLHTMFYQNEIRRAVEYGSTDNSGIRQEATLVSGFRQLSQRPFWQDFMQVGPRIVSRGSSG